MGKVGSTCNAEKHTMTSRGKESMDQETWLKNPEVPVQAWTWALESAGHGRCSHLHVNIQECSPMFIHVISRSSCLVCSYTMNLQAPWERAGPIVDIIVGVDNTGPQPEIMLQGQFIYSCLFVGFHFLTFFPLYRFLTTNMTILV